MFGFRQPGISLAQGTRSLRQAEEEPVMKTATALIVMAVGAVFAFAVDAHFSFLNLQAAGWILILLGAAGLVVPRRGYGWLRRQLVVHSGPDGRPAASFRRRDVPPYLMINPAGAPGAAFDTAVMPAEAEITQVIPDEEIVGEFFPE
jgi:hypothetical protein